MFVPRITEDPLPLARVERDDFADDPAPAMPRREGYHRASQRELVRQSLNSFLHTSAYEREDR